MDGYAVIISALVKPELTDRQLTAIGTEANGIISYDSRTSVLRYTTSDQRADALPALADADTTLARAIHRHAGAEHLTREARVLPWDEFEAETFRPATPRGGLAGVAEAAEILGVSTARVHQLRASHQDFPKPVAELKAGPVWDLEQIQTWERGWERKRTGRPPKGAPQSGE